MSVRSDTQEVRIPEPHMNLNPDKILTLVCWRLLLLSTAGEECKPENNLASVTKHNVSNYSGFVRTDHKLFYCFQILQSYWEPGNRSMRKLILVTLHMELSQCCHISSCCGRGGRVQGVFPEHLQSSCCVRMCTVLPC